MGCAHSARRALTSFPLSSQWELHRLGEDATVTDIAYSLYGDSLWAYAVGALNGLSPDSILCRDDRVVVMRAGLGENARPEPATPDPRGFLRLHDNALVAYDRGTWLAREGRAEEALPHLAEAVRLSPGMAEAHYNMGIIFRRLGKDDQAVRALERAVVLRPSREVYRYALGVVYARVGRRGDARHQFRGALVIDPHYLEARFALARLLEKMGRDEEARKEWYLYLRDDDRSPWAEEARKRLRQLDWED